MPNYTYRDTKTGEEHDISMKISDWEQFLKDNPDYEWVPKVGLATVDPVTVGVKKVDRGFNDLLKTIKKGSPRSKVNTHY